MHRKSVSPKLKRLVATRAEGCCEYCRSQVRFALQSFSVEHIRPVYAGGKTTLENLALACEGCNSQKHTKVYAFDPVSRDLVPLFHPRRQSWIEHFTWNDDFSLIVGITPIGRATVDALQLNREGVVNLRRMLHLFGEHPPESLK